MSDWYVGKTPEDGAEKIFSKRLIYKYDTANPDYKNLMDFNFAEKHLYGRVTKFHFVPMVPYSTIAPLEKFHATISDGGAQSALNFVVDAFNALNNQFTKCIMNGQINPADPFLSKLRIFKSYQNPTHLYTQHLLIYKATLASLLNQERANITNFDQLILKVMPMLEKSARKNPFTMPAYVKSNFCPINVSGLVVEIADIDPNDDVEKIEKFYNSLNWEFYLNACRSYGFMVDKMIPWRMVADIGSPRMLEYARVYGMTSTNEVLRGAYQKVHRLYFQSFKNTFYNLYQEARQDHLYEPVDCAEMPGAIKIVVPRKYTPTAFFEQYTDEYFLQLYCKIRFFEEESQFTESEQAYIIDDCVEMASYDFGKALDSFENILNKPFDYRGSLGYIKDKHAKQQR